MSQEELLRSNFSNHLGFPVPRAIAEIRVTLALAILMAVSFLPAPTLLPLFFLYGVIGAYIVSALVLYWIALNKPQLVRKGLIFWLDAGWLLTIVGFSGNLGSPLFLLLLLPILVAAAQDGFAQGMAGVIITTLAYFLWAGWLGDGIYFKAEQFLQAGTLLVLGFMVSRWAGSENDLKRELGTLNRLAGFHGLHDDEASFWIDILEELASYFGTETVFFLGLEEDGSYRIYEHETRKQARSMNLSEQQATLLNSLPERWAIVWRSVFINPRHGTARVMDLAEEKTLEVEDDRLQALADNFESRRWLSFPLHNGSAYRGRIFLLGRARFRCKIKWTFIRQLARQIGLQWDNFRLTQQLTQTVAIGERERISRDLHDGTVQPYLGLKYGLEALRRRMADNNELLADVDELVGMTDTGIMQLRGYIHDLRSPEDDVVSPALTMVRSQVRQFQAYSGLKVEISAQPFDLGESKLLEVRQIIAEGLSNIRRHSNTRQATLDISIDRNNLNIAFINPVTHSAPSFTPRSLTERATAMGGGVEVSRLATQTMVKVVLPLWIHKKT